MYTDYETSLYHLNKWWGGKGFLHLYLLEVVQKQLNTSEKDLTSTVHE